jgi:hypothetical protein
MRCEGFTAVAGYIKLYIRLLGCTAVVKGVWLFWGLHKTVVIVARLACAFLQGQRVVVA